MSTVVIETVKSTISVAAVMDHQAISGGFMVVPARTEGGDPSSGRHAVFMNINGTTEETA